MKKIWLTRFVLFFALGSLLLTGCIEIKEEVTFNKKMGGTMTYTFDLSGMKAMAGMLGGGTDINDLAKKGDKSVADKNPMAKMDEAIAELTQKLSAVKGVKNIKKAGKPADFIYGVSFSFANLEALNGALKAMSGNRDGGNVFVLSADKKEIVKKMSTPGEGLEGLEQLLGGAAEGEDSEENAKIKQGLEMAKMFLKDAKYTVVCNFKKKVAGGESATATVTTEGKTVTSTLPFLSLLDNKTASNETKIRLK